MPDYLRTTCECSFNQLRPELQTAVREYTRKHELGNPEKGLLICCETTSERPLGLWGRLIGAEKVHYTAALVTPQWLIWATSGEKRQTVVLAARLREIEVNEFNSKLVEDHGLEIHGFLHGASEKSLAFIGLGHEPAAEKFKQVLKQTIGENLATTQLPTG